MNIKNLVLYISLCFTIECVVDFFNFHIFNSYSSLTKRY